LTQLQLALDDFRRSIDGRAPVYAIHYACESFYTALDHPSGISAISVSTVPPREDFTFTVRDHRGDDAERSTLSEFYDWLRSVPDSRILHWNMGKSEYGFRAIAKRYAYLGGQQAYEHASDRLLDLDDALMSAHGRDYAAHPRLSSMIGINGIDVRYSLSGEEQAALYASGDHARLALCTAERARAIAELAVLFFDGGIRVGTSSPGAAHQAAEQAKSYDAAPIVFVSDLAKELREGLETLFGDSIVVFVSSAPTSIGAGDRWVGNIDQALGTCKVIVVLAGPSSVQRPWLNFEAGAGWGRDVPVIPACHSGLTPGSISPPLGFLQGITLSDPVDLSDRLVPAIGRATGGSAAELDFPEWAARLAELAANLLDDLGLGDETLFVPEPVASGIVSFDDDWLAEQESRADRALRGSE
jgi:hypothetical protein